MAIPKLGLGTWRIENDAVARVVRNAAEIGYRHFDTAQAYDNERGVGEGLRASSVSRNALFVTTKLAAECKTYAEAKARIEGSLRALGLDHIDLMLIHSPQPWSEFRQADNSMRAIWRHGARSKTLIATASCARSASAIRAGRPGQSYRQRHGRADGQPDPCSCRQHAFRPDRLQSQQGH